MGSQAHVPPAAYVEVQGGVALLQQRPLVGARLRLLQGAVVVAVPALRGIVGGAEQRDDGAVG